MNIKTVLTTYRRGILMSANWFYRVVQIVLTVASLVFLLSAPWTVPSIENHLWRALAWIFILVIAIFAAIATILPLYFGQKLATEESQNQGRFLEGCLNEERAKIGTLEKKLAIYKEKFGNLNT